MLHITNGLVVSGLLRTLGLKGDIVEFHDLLHEGPVQAGLSPAALRESRATFLTTLDGGLTRERALQGLATRDQTVISAASHDEVVLWFEHDLFDQLQVLQVLDLLPNGGRPRISAVVTDDYLGKHSPAHLATLFTKRREVEPSARAAARTAWTAFRSSDPRAVLDAVPRVGALPHLPAALMRHLQQFPAVGNGLSRTEAQALSVIANGASRMADVYVQSHLEREEAVFMGDTGFVFHMRTVFEPPVPLLMIVRRGAASGPLSLDDSVALTDDGLRVLEGSADRVRVSGIERWLGGVHLSGKGALWRWDDATKKVILL